MINLSKKYFSRQGCELKIVKYVSAKEIYIQVEEGDIIKVEGCQLTRGNFINRNKPTVLNVGYIGFSGYVPREEGLVTLSYNRWIAMLNRCYNNSSERNPTYKGCTVCEEWLSYQNYAKWFWDNYIEDWHVDKDILKKGNRVYCPEYCCFVPQEINCLLNRRQKGRGKLKIGVSWNKDKKMFTAQASRATGSSHLIGTSSTEIGAFNLYKEFKEQRIKSTAVKFKGLIKANVFTALSNYIVEEDD